MFVVTIVLSIMLFNERERLSTKLKWNKILKKTPSNTHTHGKYVKLQLNLFNLNPYLEIGLSIYLSIYLHSLVLYCYYVSYLSVLNNRSNKLSKSNVLTIIVFNKTPRIVYILSSIMLKPYWINAPLCENCLKNPIA